MLDASCLAIEPGSTERRIREFLRIRLSESRRRGVVLGLSGGLDSSVATVLCAKSLESMDTLALIMPHRDSNPEDKEHALLVTEKFKIPYRVIDITGVVDAAIVNITQLVSSTGKDNLAEQKFLNAVGNVKARVRMIILYLAANTTNRLVVGSGDKSEFLIGYYTKYGDGGADIFPLADLYKTQVRDLARHLGIPEAIIGKPSSPGLWKGQAAEEEIGMKYEQLDLILCGLERFMKPEEVAEELGISIETVNSVQGMIRRAEHKRRGGIVFKVGYRTPTMDWRTPL